MKTEARILPGTIFFLFQTCTPRWQPRLPGCGSSTNVIVSDSGGRAKHYLMIYALLNSINDHTMTRLSCPPDTSQRALSSFSTSLISSSSSSPVSASVAAPEEPLSGCECENATDWQFFLWYASEPSDLNVLVEYNRTLQMTQIECIWDRTNDVGSHTFHPSHRQHTPARRPGC